MKFSQLVTSIALVGCAAATGTAQANGFVNGGFEDGNSGSWTRGAGYRGLAATLNPLSPSQFLPGGTYYDPVTNNGLNRSSIINGAYVDPNLGSRLGSTVYSGLYSFRVEDTTSGGYASVLSQTVTNYTDTNIFFAYKAVLENGGHSVAESASFTIVLTDVTKGSQVFYDNITANPTSAGPDPRFQSFGSLYYTPNWIIANIAVGAANLGDTFRLDILGADCEPTGHTGYVYIDGFGAVIPPVVTGVPEPETLALAGLGLVGLALVRRRRAKQ